MTISSLLYLPDFENLTDLVLNVFCAQLNYEWTSVCLHLISFSEMSQSHSNPPISEKSIVVPYMYVN